MGTFRIVDTGGTAITLDSSINLKVKKHIGTGRVNPALIYKQRAGLDGAEYMDQYTPARQFSLVIMTLTDNEADYYTARQSILDLVDRHRQTNDLPLVVQYLYEDGSTVSIDAYYNGGMGLDQPRGYKEECVVSFIAMDPYWANGGNGTGGDPDAQENTQDLGATSSGTANYIVEKRGPGAWSVLQDGMNGPVYAVQYDSGGTLHAGGDYGTAGTIATGSLAHYDHPNEKWIATGGGVDGTVLTLNFQPGNDGSINVGGKFGSALSYGTISAGSMNNIGRYGLTSDVWETFNYTAGTVTGIGLNDTVRTIGWNAANQMVAGGDFTQVNNVTVSASGTVDLTGSLVWESPSWAGSAISGDYLQYLVMWNNNNISTSYIFGGYDGGSELQDTDGFDTNSDVWISKTNMPSPARRTSASTTVNARGYIFGGDNAGSRLRDTDEYNPDVWTSKTNMPSPARSRLTSTTIDNKGYIFGGYDGYATNETDEYDPDTWIGKANIPSPYREGLASTTIDGKGYIFGGYQTFTFYQDTDEYSPNTWISKTNIPSPARQQHISTTINSKGYIFGGDSSGTGELQDTDEYNPDVWTSKTDIPSPARRTSASTTVNARGYIFGGFGTSVITDNDEYNPDTWTSKTDMPSPARQMLTATAPGDNYWDNPFTFSDEHLTIYDSSLSQYEYTDPQRLDTDGWDYDAPTTYSGTSNADTPHSYAPAIVIPDNVIHSIHSNDQDVSGTAWVTMMGGVQSQLYGYILGVEYSDSISGRQGYVFCGYDGGSRLQDTDEYDPDVWTGKTNSPSPARRHTSSSNIDEKCYIFGGFTTIYLQDTDEYNAGVNTWSSKTDIPSPARGYTSSIDINGKCYIFGGYTGSHVQDTDEYSPDTWSSKTNVPSPARASMGACSIRSAGYIFGGWIDTPGVRTLDTDEYNPDTWTNKADTPAPSRSFGASSNIDSKGYLFCGSDTSNNELQDCDEYDPVGNSWANKTDAPAPARDNAPANNINGIGYIFGGNDGASYYQDTDEYDPDSWTSKTDMPAPGRDSMGSSPVRDVLLYNAYFRANFGTSNMIIRDNPSFSYTKGTTTNPLTEYVDPASVFPGSIIDSGTAGSIYAPCDYFSLPYGFNEGTVLTMSTDLNGVLWMGGNMSNRSDAGQTLQGVSTFDGVVFENKNVGVAGERVSELAYQSSTNSMIAVGDFTEAGDDTTIQKVAIHKNAIWNSEEIDFTNAGTVNCVAVNGSTIAYGFSSPISFVVPSSQTVNNTSNVQIYPIFEFTGPGQLNSVTNATTGKTIGFDNLVLGATETMYIILTSGSKSIYSNIRSDLTSYLSEPHDYDSFFLAPGNNTIYSSYSTGMTTHNILWTTRKVSL